MVCLTTTSEGPLLLGMVPRLFPTFWCKDNYTIDKIFNFLTLLHTKSSRIRIIPYLPQSQPFGASDHDNNMTLELKTLI